MAGGRPLALWSSASCAFLCGAHPIPQHLVFPRATLRPSRGPTPSEKSSDAPDVPSTVGLLPSGTDGGPDAPHSEGQVHDASHGQLPDHSGREDHHENPTVPNDGVGASSEAGRATDEMTDARDGDDTSRSATRRVATLQMTNVLRSGRSSFLSAMRLCSVSLFFFTCLALSVVVVLFPIDCVNLFNCVLVQVRLPPLGVATGGTLVTPSRRRNGVRALAFEKR